MTDHLLLSVPDMTCGHCEAAVKQEVGALAGVTSVVVDLDAKLVTVAGERLQRDDVIAAIDEAGFDVA